MGTIKITVQAGYYKYDYDIIPVGKTQTILYCFVPAKLEPHLREQLSIALSVMSDLYLYEIICELGYYELNSKIQTFRKKNCEGIDNVITFAKPAQKTERKQCQIKIKK